MAPASPLDPPGCAGLDRGCAAKGEWKMLDWWPPFLAPLVGDCCGNRCAKLPDRPVGGRPPPPPLLLPLGPAPADAPAAPPALAPSAALGCCGEGGGSDGCPGSLFCERSASSTAFAHSLRESALCDAPACMQPW